MLSRYDRPDDVDVHNTSEVLFRLCANTDPQRDSIFTKGPPTCSTARLPRLRWDQSWGSMPPKSSREKVLSVHGLR
jgi:hypothetical protein